MKQDAGKVSQRKKSVIWLNQTNQISQINQIDQTIQSV